MSRTALVVLALATMVLGATLLGAAPAAAHIPVHETLSTNALPSAETARAARIARSGETLGAGPAAPSAPWAVLLSLAAVAVAGAWRPRRAVALALVLVAAVFAFEAGVHSTHHLGQTDDITQCLVAGVSAQLSADVADAIVDASPLALVQSAVTTVTTPALVARSLAPDAGRAPPTLRSA
ncbi:MAG: hypothetical protein FJZ38_14690 [Candidatus Rokubacteria bacterium]|nr:hypothetical protein [Candidatus Rokubacteria bacterium]